MKNTFSLLALLLTTLLMSLPVHSAIQASASVSDTNIILGDIFILTVSINDNDDDYQLDTRPLEKDFTVYLPSQSKRSEFINGSFSQRTEWRVRLQAQKEGTFTIPSFKIGDYLTEPIEIKVSELSQANMTTQDDIFIENSINKDSVYIGQSFIFTTKLYISKNSNDLDLKAPTLKVLKVRY
ncbi:BatD family protein [Psychromonas sp. KJ10-10]|uniref:BatD family protein n=1 Tax=Psychromonas sp. KJ10-10 TaxID=3391823 RepID=UPI0039B66E63